MTVHDPTAHVTGTNRVPSGPDDADRPLHPRIRLLWWISAVGSDLLLIGGAVVAAVLAQNYTDLELPTWWWTVAIALAVVSVLARSWYVRAAYRAWRYRFGPDGLDLASGVFWKRTTSVPYHRLQQVDVGQGPLERRLGVSTVQLRTAAATTDATIPGIDADEVAELRGLLLERAGRDDGA